MPKNPVIILPLDRSLPEWASNLSFGQAGLAFASSLALVALDVEEYCVSISLFLFAVTIPAGVCHGFLCRAWHINPYSTAGWNRVSAITSLCTHITMFAGVYFIFLSVSVLHGIVFGLACLAAYGIWRGQLALFQSISRGSLHPLPGGVAQPTVSTPNGMKKNEQDEPQQPPLAALSQTSSVVS